MKTDAERTPEEQALIDEIAEKTSQEWAEEHATMIIAQAELAGDL